MVEPPGYREFVEARSAALQRTAWLLTGNWASAEDLVQVALAKVWPRWEMVAGSLHGNPGTHPGPRKDPRPPASHRTPVYVGSPISVFGFGLAISSQVPGSLLAAGKQQGLDRLGYLPGSAEGGNVSDAAHQL